jgi:hypothetical protein
MIDLIYCAGGNPRLSQIAVEEGFLIGFRSDYAAPAHPISFVDVEYRNPNFMAHLETVKKHRPKYATVPDLSEKAVSRDDVARAIQQAERLAPYCEIPLIVPKLSGQLGMIPTEYAIGYSIPTSYGGAQYPLWELSGRKVHLLGGSPRKQLEIYRYLSCFAEVISADGNYAQLMATRFAEFWNGKKWIEHPKMKTGDKDLYFECWRWSCQHIYQDWKKLTGGYAYAH